MMKRLKKAFTITELVIVIAVIAILAAVLIPTFSHVVSNANQSAAMQNCHNAMVEYISEVTGDKDPDNDNANGMVFVSNDYAFVYASGNLQSIGKLSKLAYIDKNGATNGTLPEGITVNNVTADATMFVNGKSEASIKLNTLQDGQALYFYKVEVNGSNLFGCFVIKIDENEATNGANRATFAAIDTTLTFAPANTTPPTPEAGGADTDADQNA